MWPARASEFKNRTAWWFVLIDCSAYFAPQVTVVRDGREMQLTLKVGSLNTLSKL